MPGRFGKNMVEIINKIVEKINPELLLQQKNWIDEDLISSLEIINLLTDLEEAFHIMIDPEDIIPENFNSLPDVIKLIRKYANND